MFQILYASGWMLENADAPIGINLCRIMLFTTCLVALPWHLADQLVVLVAEAVIQKKFQLFSNVVLSK